MDCIKVCRYTDHSQGYQGAILPEGGAWQVVIDKDGGPHLFVRVRTPDGEPAWLGVDDLLDVPPANIIDCVATETDDVDEETAAFLERHAGRESVMPV